MTLISAALNQTFASTATAAFYLCWAHTYQTVRFALPCKPFLLLAQTVGLVQPDVVGAGRVGTDEEEEEQKGENKYAKTGRDSSQNVQQMLCSRLQHCI